MRAYGNIPHGIPKRFAKRRLIASEDGSSLVELGVLLPLVVVIILAATELAVYMQRSMMVVEAASVGARFGVIAGNASNVTGMATAAQNAAAGLSGFSVTATAFCSCTPGGAAVSCSLSCPSTIPISHYVRVTTSATVPGIFNVAGLPKSMTPTAVSTMRASWYGN